MSNQILFVPQEMYEMAADLEVWADDLRAVGDDVDLALDRFRRSSSELVPELPAHGNAIAVAAELMTALGENVALVGAAAEEAERAGVRNFRDVVLAIAAGIRLADIGVTVPAALQRLVATSVHGTRAIGNSTRLWNIGRQYGSRPMPDIASIRARTPGGATMPRAEVRAVQLATYRHLKKTRRGLLRGSRDARSALRTNRPVTGLGERVPAFLDTSRTGRALKVGSKALGGLGAAASVVDAGLAVKEEDYERAATSGLLAAGGVMMLTPNPLVAGAGAVVVVGVTVYENWDTISGWADRAWDGATGAASSVVGGAGRILSGLF